MSKSFKKNKEYRLENIKLNKALRYFVSNPIKVFEPEANKVFQYILFKKELVDTLIQLIPKNGKAV